MGFIKFIKGLFLAMGLLLCQILPAYSIQNIINMPSSEVLPEGTMMLRDSNNIPTDGVMRTSPGFILGVGNGVEVSGRVTTFVSGDDEVRSDLAVKKVFYIGNSSRFVVGGRVSPLLNRNGEPTSFVYSSVAHRLKKTKTSLVAGVYTANRDNCIPNNFGVMMGIDQVIIPNKLRLAVDYMSGNEDYAVFGVGLKYRPMSTLTVNSGVIISPREEGRVAFSISVSKFISIKSLMRSRERL